MFKFLENAKKKGKIEDLIFEENKISEKYCEDKLEYFRS